MASSALMAFAIPLAAEAQNATSEVQEVVVTGSRFGPRVVTDSLTPIDSISSQDLAKTGATNLQGQIKLEVPSFSTPRPVGAGANDFLEAPTLRGLSPGQLLMLVNGKRRHTNAELSNGSQIGRGDVSYDFNAIPEAAISRVEVLRDGAAAQYPSSESASYVGRRRKVARKGRGSPYVAGETPS